MQRIENYDNYREFLRDIFIDRKKRFPFFSNRYFCQKSGIKSPSLYQEVVEGKRNLTDNTIKSFIKGLGLTDWDASFFTILVHLNQSKNAQERELYLSQLKGLRQKVKQQVVPADHYEYFSKWYNPVIRELCCLMDWKENYELLAKSVKPQIKMREARASVELLIRLGFLIKDHNGRYHQSSPAITGSKDIQASGIRNLNRQFSELGTIALDEFSPDQRYISSMTVGISEEAYKQIVQEFLEFKDRILRIVDDDKHSDAVYNINLQIFPVSTIAGDNNE